MTATTIHCWYTCLISICNLIVLLFPNWRLLTNPLKKNKSKMSSWFWKSHALLVIEVRSYNFYSILFTINDTKTIYQHNHIQHGKRLQEKSENDCTTISTFMTPTNPYIINILQLPPDSISITLLLRSSSNIGNGLVHFLVTVSLKILADFISKSKKSLEILVQKSDTSF